MGAWDASLYGNDDAADLCETFGVFVRLPEDAGRLVERIKDATPGMCDPASEGYADLWLALADQLHAYGLEDAETTALARRLIESDDDLRAKSELGMSADDLALRRGALDALLVKWATPSPKPKPRKICKAPEAHVFEAGAIVAYPTSRGEAANPYVPEADGYLGWKQDGWGAFVVLASGHATGFFAWVLIGRLSAHGAGKPSFTACRDAAIENQPWFMNESGMGTRAVQLRALPALRAKRMRLEQLGRVELEAIRVTEIFADDLVAPRPPFPVPISVMEWWDTTRPRRSDPTPGVAAPSAAVPLAALTRS